MTRGGDFVNKFWGVAGALVLAVGLVACGINLPGATVGPVQTEQVNVPKPAGSDTVWNVELDPGAATITVGTNAEGLVEGTIDYNVAALKPTITTGDGQVTIKAGDLDNKIVTGENVKNDWKLRLGQGVPMKLTVNAGATQGRYELGGLSLQALNWNQGASAATVNFGEPNPDKLTAFDVTAGAASLTMTGLANTNLGTATFKVGAGSLTLAFDGALAQDATITVEGGASALTIISGGNPVQVETGDNALSGVSKGAWTQAGQTFSSPEWTAGNGPRIMIRTDVGVGGVKLLTSK
jgi:hypothetical protein